MAYTRDWDNSTPADHTAEPDTPLKIRQTKTDVSERLKNMLYGFTSGETDEGFKYAPFKVQTSDPTATANQVRLYTKDVSSKAELHFIDEDGNVKQVTTAGKLNIASDEAVLLTGDQTVAGVKTFSSIPVGPSSDPSSDNEFARKKYVDTQVDAVDAKIKSLGDYSAKSYGTAYEATTDGFVVAYASADDSITLTGYTDSNTSPTTVVAKAGHGATNASEIVSITFPVKKGHYWKVDESHSGTLSITVNWVPMGS